MDALVMTTAPPPIPPNRLKELREQAGLTQEQVARFIGVTHAAVNRWENRVNAISSRYLFELAKVLRCKPGEILSVPDDEEPMTPTQRRIYRITKTWDEEALTAILHFAEEIERWRVRGKR